MVAIKNNTRIEIWSSSYINTLKERSDEDKNVRIVQIQPGSGQMEYIVEIEDLDKSGTDNFDEAFSVVANEINKE